MTDPTEDTRRRRQAEIAAEAADRAALEARPARLAAAGIVAGTTLLSVGLNVLAFLAGAAGPAGVVLGCVAGVMLPLLVLALSYLGSAFALATPKAVGRPARGK